MCQGCTPPRVSRRQPLCLQAAVKLHVAIEQWQLVSYSSSALRSEALAQVTDGMLTPTLTFTLTLTLGAGHRRHANPNLNLTLTLTLGKGHRRHAHRPGAARRRLDAAARLRSDRLLAPCHPAASGVARAFRLNRAPPRGIPAI